MATFFVVVEVMFDGMTWTDITSYVRVSEGIIVTRGRGDEQAWPAARTTRTSRRGVASGSASWWVPPAIRGSTAT
jgi:hypothetical protein